MSAYNATVLYWFVIGVVLGVSGTALIARQWVANIKDETYHAGIERGRELERLAQQHQRVRVIVNGKDVGG